MTTGIKQYSESNLDKIIIATSDTDELDIYFTTVI